MADYRPRAAERDSGRAAAVLVPVVGRADGDHLLFTERSPDLEAHPGETAFPGGGYEPEDADLAGTALREANEEVGIRPEETEIVGRLDDVPGPYGHVVRPFVARVPDRAYEPDRREVVEVVVLSAADLTDPSIYSVEERRNPEGETVDLPFFRVDGDVVWGLTGFILARFLSVVSPWKPPGGFPQHPLLDEGEQSRRE
ncbi:coenzyme A pyrophosphatase [Halobacteriales archaeon QS_5_70_15]|nr:MAG: coenzyme A pyrophosphatase [Halobacteriales archaeon QS_5_70_15]